MNQNNTLSTSTEGLDGVLHIISQLAKIAHVGHYIFRGESEHFDNVSSSLYRQYEENGISATFDAEGIEKRLIGRARAYTDETDELEILSQLQHYGGKTNLIDFTSDYLTALFFACYAAPTKDARVILLKRTEAMAPYVKEPRRTANRVIAQHSIFVLPPQGLIESYEIVDIPKKLKQPILGYLHHCHGISAETIFNDLHGFIRLENIHNQTIAMVSSGLASAEEGDYQQAIKLYTTAIEANPRMAHAYTLRGNVYRGTGDIDHAIRDYDLALDLNPGEGHIHYHRGDAYFGKGDIENAIRDYSRAIDLDPSDIDAHQRRALALIQIGEFAQAIHDCERIIDLDPNNPHGYYYRATALLNDNNQDNFEFRLLIGDGHVSIPAPEPRIALRGCRER